MKRLLKSFVALLVIGLVCPAFGYAQTAITKKALKKLVKAPAIEVVYQYSYKGKVYPSKTLMTVSGDEAVVESMPMTARNMTQSGDENPFGFAITKNYVDYANLKSYRLAEFSDGRTAYSETDIKLGEGKTDRSRQQYLGLDCSVMHTVINSNGIEIWYTNALPFKGTPQANVGVPDGLVLRVIRNGETIQEAVEIRPLKTAVDVIPDQLGEKMDASTLQYAINQSGVITVPIFDQARINFDGAKVPEALVDGEIYNVAGGSIIIKKVKLPEQSSNRSVWAEVVQYSDGDAYDRTGSIFMIPTDKKQSFIDALRDLKSVPSFRSGDSDYHGLVSTPDYDVPMELMRFFTGFGVRKYNHNKVPGQQWVDSVLYKSEVTNLADRLVGDVWIGAYIGNWDGKGHKLSLRLKYHPEGERKVYRTMPLFNTVNYMEQAGQPYPIFMLNDSLKVKFTLSEPVKGAMLHYTTTGHGGWGGGDEFNQKVNTICLDGKQMISFIPWREDCGTYRNWNPCSGNFSNGLSSSDGSRSNWCPATVTNPEYIFLGDLDAGEHLIEVKIPQGAPEGHSNSYWCISGTLLY